MILQNPIKIEYSEFEKVNTLWKSYVNSCLLTCLHNEHSSLSEENVLNCLKQIDYHGCLLSVAKSSTKSLFGMSGVVLQDRRNVFYLVTRDNQVKIVPKVGNLFEFELFNSAKITIVGSNMLYRPEMRITKHAKIKTKSNIR